MDPERANELFCEGWREPGDDTERLTYVLWMILEVPLSLAMMAFGLSVVTRPDMVLNAEFSVWTVLGGLFLTGIGLGLFVSLVAFFVKEIPQLQLRKLTADRFVA